MREDQADNLVNVKFTQKVADELREKFDSALGDWDFVPGSTHVYDAWIEVAKVAIARLMPIAVNSELPNDALTSGKRPLGETVDNMVGNPTEHGKNKQV